MENTSNRDPLEPYQISEQYPWDVTAVQHVYNRLEFGANRTTIEIAVKQSPQAVINKLIDRAFRMQPTPAPEWANWSKKQIEDAGLKQGQIKSAWKSQMAADMRRRGLHGRLVLFWSNHFVTELQDYKQITYMYQYYKLLQVHAIKNFKRFVKDVGTTPAMLIYLNGFQNRKGNPNENYARELYELFTLGVDNGYTQQDIVETAKALTGWNHRPDSFSPISFRTTTFDNSQKRIFNQVGNFDHDQVIDLLFERRKQQIAKFICGKMYQHFCAHEIHGGVVGAMAKIMVDTNFAIRPVLAELFRSHHFMTRTRGTLIKSPADYFISFIKTVDFEYQPKTQNDLDGRLMAASRAVGQEFLDPIDVAGWPGDTSWISSSHYLTRWDRMDAFIKSAWGRDKEQFRNLAVQITKGISTKDHEKIAVAIANHFLARKLTFREEYQEVIAVFADQVPENYFEDNRWDLKDSDPVPRQVLNLLLYIIRIPEFQLK